MDNGTRFRYIFRSAEKEAMKNCGQMVSTFKDSRRHYKDNKSAFGLSANACNRLVSDTSANLFIFFERTDTAYG